MGDILYFTKPFYFPPEKNKQEPWLTRTPHASIPVEFGYHVWMEPIEFGYHVFLRDTQWVLKQDPLTYYTKVLIYHRHDHRPIHHNHRPFSVVFKPTVIC
jgi:hypothetical protein